MVIVVMASSEISGINNFIEIDLKALRCNYQSIVSWLGDGVRVMAIVKADAYGHGLLPVAQTLFNAGARTFGVAEVGEGIKLRKAGVEGEIVVLLGVMADSFAEILEFDLQPVVYDPKGLEALSAYAATHGHQVAVHLKIDTGMGRLGIMPDQLDNCLGRLEKLPGVRLAGVLSHFPRADDLADQSQVVAQNQYFAEILAKVSLCAAPDTAHIANSAAMLNLLDSHYDMVRPGITLYGYYPFPERAKTGLPLKPVMSFKSRLLQIKDVPSGYGISYGHTYKTRRPTRLAVLPVGYADGYLRRLSGRAEVIVAGQRVPILGRICMNACLADITGLDQVRAGDEVVLMGRQGEAEITADEIAVWADTISYEILCLLGGNNKRIYRSE